MLGWLWKKRACKYVRSHFDSVHIGILPTSVKHFFFFVLYQSYLVGLLTGRVAVEGVPYFGEFATGEFGEFTSKPITLMFLYINTLIYDI